VFELESGKHHDHLICVRCGKIVEFVDDAIESKQKEIAEKMVLEFLIIRSLFMGCVITPTARINNL
jgi:Fe2+ or Zn2+ uptake regulation protein